MSGVHDGHRKRVREQFLREGFAENTPEHKLLEMLLFYGIPRKDTNEIAHQLIDTFGSFSGVLDASPEDLMKVSGITQNTACLIKMIMPLSRHYTKSRFQNCRYLTTKEAAADYLLERFSGRTLETVFVLCLDNKGKILGCPMVSEGDEISVGVSARTVVEQVFKTHATVVMVAHNHPMGMALPSEGDITVTQNIAMALRHLSVEFLDHIIVADGDYVSMADTRELRDIFKNNKPL